MLRLVVLTQYRSVTDRQTDRIAMSCVAFMRERRRRAIKTCRFTARCEP